MKQEENITKDFNGFKKGYAPVNGLDLYYEIHGDGYPLVLIHGGGSTIGTTFGRVLPALAQQHRVIAVELQEHGHTPSIDRLLSFEQDADDVAALLEYLDIEQAHIMGFSNGGNTAMQIAIRHPKKVHKLIIASAFFQREGMMDGFWDFMPNATLDNMPQLLQEEYLKVAPNPADLVKMHDQDRDRMLRFRDWDPELLRSIQAPVFVMAADQDVIKPEHTVAMYRLFPHAQLAIFPGYHGAFLGEITFYKPGDTLPAIVVGMINEFLAVDPAGEII